MPKDRTMVSTTEARNSPSKSSIAPTKVSSSEQRPSFKHQSRMDPVLASGMFLADKRHMVQSNRQRAFPGMTRTFKQGSNETSAAIDSNSKGAHGKNKTRHQINHKAEKSQQEIEESIRSNQARRRTRRHANQKSQADGQGNHRTK